MDPKSLTDLRRTIVTSDNAKETPGPRYGRSLVLAVLAALVVRLLVVVFVYQGFLEPGRDHWEFGYEVGMVARSIASGHGFANPFWEDTGPTALLTPVFPYL